MLIMQDVIKGVQENKEKFQKQLEDGDVLATRVYDMYSLYYACPESGSEGLTIAAYEDWAKQNLTQTN